MTTDEKILLFLKLCACTPLNHEEEPLNDLAIELLGDLGYDSDRLIRGKYNLQDDGSKQLRGFKCYADEEGD